ncbi:MAG: ankyrin repeat domain-containing protein [Rhodocyclaceae bacterium]|nr:ankyrin repeat domain-containing protein [Rhodocyclaceae bacterium]
MKRLSLLPFLLAACFLAAPAAAAGFTPPDPVHFRNQMEVGNLSLASEWLAAGLDPDYQGDAIGSGLMIAAWTGNLPLLELFLERGADPARRNALGEDALMHAAWKGHAEVVRRLLARGLRPDRPALQWTALHYAAFSGHGEVVRLLLEAGADLNARSPNGSTPLMMAVYEGREDLARWLVDKGADRSVRNDWGDRALEWAFKFNRLGVARAVAPPQEFAAAASKPKAEWGEAKRSEPTSEALLEMLRIREILAERKLNVDKLDRRIAAERVKIARGGVAPEAAPPAATVLEIRASRSAPERQSARMIREGGR